MIEKGLYLLNHQQLNKLHFKSYPPLIIETSYLFTNRLSFPEEDELAKVYLKLALGGLYHPFIISLYDPMIFTRKVGLLRPIELKDDSLDAFHLLLAVPNLFPNQLRALLRISYQRKAWILLPSLRKKEELNYIVNQIEDILARMSRERYVFDRYPKIGIKITNPISLLHIEDFSRIDFLIFDFDSILLHFLGLTEPQKPLLKEYLPNIEGDLDLFIHWLEGMPMEEKWCGFTSFMPIENWGKLIRLPWQVFFEKSGEFSE